MFIKRVDNYIFVAPAVRRKNKKYDAYTLDGEYITSFGALNYQHYRDDKIGYYKDLSHNDKIRRDRYRKRHMHDNLDNPYSAGYLSMYYLWT
jgi:hypothetical protein